MSKRTYSDEFTPMPLDDLAPLMQECLAQGQEVVLTITGNSMSPFVRDKRDHVVLTACDPMALQPGDVPLYHRSNGQYVLHRIIKRDDGQVCHHFGKKETTPSTGSELRYTMMGDAQSYEEPGIRPDQIIAVATAFIRKGKRWECAGKAYRRNRLRWNRLRPLRKKLIWWDRRLEWRFRRLFPYKGR